MIVPEDGLLVVVGVADAIPDPELIRFLLAEDDQTVLIFRSFEEHLDGVSFTQRSACHLGP